MSLKRSAVLLPLVLAACSEAAPDLAPMQASLPTETDLPHHYSQDCDCVRDGECIVVDAIPGYSEIRDLSCRWLRPGREAHCRFEQRFVEFSTDEQGKLITKAPEPWEPASLRAILLPDGRWCAG